MKFRDWFDKKMKTVKESEVLTEDEKKLIEFGWNEDLEKAPKDGSSVLVIKEGRRCEVINWSLFHNCWVPDDQPERIVRAPWWSSALWRRHEDMLCDHVAHISKSLKNKGE